ncbi:MAG: toprim domain-containing protein [Acidimicrobiales bacterium]
MGPTGLPRVLYARDLFDALDNPAPPLWIAEGPADAIALAHLFADVDAAIVAIPGTSGVHRWAPMLADRDVLIATDPDEPGDRAAAELERLAVERGGRADRLRPPLDLDDWRRQYPR